MPRLTIALLLLGCVVDVALRQRPEADTWRFVPGRSTERLQAEASEMPTAAGEPVTLPHRVLLPDTALWYERTLTLPADAALTVDADDGAQVFVDGVRWLNESRTFVPPSRAEAGPHQVVIRVLNNAMQGGLRRVSVAAGRAAAPTAPLEPMRGLAPRPGSTEFTARMPSADRPCRFTAWADSQAGWATFEPLVRRMAASPHHFSVGVGDLVADGADRTQWARLAAALAPLSSAAAIVPVVGNHDYDGFYNDLRSRYYLELFEQSTTWSAWSCGAARFVAIDLNTEFPIGISEESDQWRWLRAQIASPAWRNAAWRVLLVHQPPFSTSWPGYSGDAATRRIVSELLAAGLDLVVSGHSHAYEHLVRSIDGRSFHVVITGGAGGGLEEPLASPPADGDRVVVQHHFVRGTVTAEAFDVEAVSVDGTVFDRWRLEHARK